MAFCTKILFMLFLWYFANYMTHCQGKNDFLIIASFYFCGFLSQGTTFSVLYLYRNSKRLHIHLFVIILNQGKMAVNDPMLIS